MKYGDALQEIVTSLKNVGLRATTEPSKLQLPGVLVVPGIITFDYLDQDNYSAVVDVYLLTSNKGSVQSLNDLQDQLALFREVYASLEAEPVTLALSNLSTDPVPGLLLNLQLTITKD